MIKLIPILGVAAAALAAAVALAMSAQAQAPPPLNIPEGKYQQQAPEQYRAPPRDDDSRNEDWRNDDRRGDEWGNDDWRGDDWRRDRGRIDFQTAQRSCSRAGIEQAWNRNYYSAQYDGAPRFAEGRRGWELRGRMRLHDRSGYRTVDTACQVRRSGEAVRFDFLR